MSVNSASSPLQQASHPAELHQQTLHELHQTQARALRSYLNSALTTMVKQRDIAENLADFTQPYGLNFKIDAYGWLEALANKQVRGKTGQIVLVTSDTPLKASRGEGKTTAVIALTDALRARGIDAAAVLRQPSMGITAAGSKGGASGGGVSSLEQVNLTDWGLYGEMAKIETAQNLIVSRAEKMHDEEPDRLATILMPRVSELPSRSLRHILVDHQINKETGTRGDLEEKTVITPASELMQIVVLSNSRAEMAERIAHMIVGQSSTGKAILASEVVDIDRIMTVLGDALNPVLTRSRQGSPVYIHAGPFGNVSLGLPSISVMKLAQSLHDVVIIEAGYGADAGAEKWIDLATPFYKAPWPTCCVVVSRASTWNNEELGWRYDFNIQRMEKVGLPAFPLLNLWSGEDDETEQLRTRARERGLREPLIGNLYRDGGEALAPQLDGLLEFLKSARAHGPAHAPSADEVATMDTHRSVEQRLYTIIEQALGVPASRVIARQDYQPSLLAARKLVESAGMNFDEFAICPIKSPSVITDNDEADADERTVTLKMTSVHAGAKILQIHVTTSLTTSMPKIV
ncbi:formate--tetrahydrofolate ligase [Aeriscardovia aeriphila]|nr:formate--tetrahydrofolate ligase [Aeriscardovia aeriphila]